MPCLEELNRLQRALRVREKKLVPLRRGRRRVALGRCEGARRVGGGEVKLVQREQHGLRQIERAVVGSRDRDDSVGAVQCFVGQSVVLPAEQERSSPLGRRVR